MIDSALLAQVKTAAGDASYASLGSRRTATVHEFYRYPARFSPDFARAAITAFTSPGDLVLDPFVGGGTTLVESRLLGRVALGTDINALAVFVSRAKTAIQSRASDESLGAFESNLSSRLRLSRSVELPGQLVELGYLRHLDRPDTWRVRNLVAIALNELEDVPTGSARLLGRCAILRTAQWALDMRSSVPSVGEFREALTSALTGMREAAFTFSRDVRHADRAAPTTLRRTRVIRASSSDLSRNRAVQAYPAPQLVVTSPPYPGVYVNYHRWKLLGRKETPAPFWIAGCLDGKELAHYTMGAKVDRTLSTYFARLEETWREIVLLTDRDTWFVQMVGFNDPSAQLPRYLEVMERVGLRECVLPELATSSDGRLWRSVPGRRWWVAARARDSTAPHTSLEVVLVHRRAAESLG